MHIPCLGGQDEVRRSQDLPVNSHLGPIILGETSPKLDEANAPTNFPCTNKKDINLDLMFAVKDKTHLPVQEDIQDSWPSPALSMRSPHCQL